MQPQLPPEFAKLSPQRRHWLRSKGVDVPLLPAGAGGGWAKRCLIKARTGKRCSSCQRRVTYSNPRFLRAIGVMPPKPPNKRKQKRKRKLP